MKILNVGCGEQKYGTHFIDLYPQREEVKECDIENEEIPFPDNFFDLVYSDNLLEHLKNPYQSLEKMIKVLKPGGKLVVITDNAGFWGWHTPFSRVHYGGYESLESRGDNDRHYVLYTPWHLKNLFRNLGLTKIKTEYMIIKDKNPSPLVRTLSRLLGLFSKKIAYSQIRVSGIK